jgi:hypothetical protein
MEFHISPEDESEGPHHYNCTVGESSNAITTTWNGQSNLAGLSLPGPYNTLTGIMPYHVPVSNGFPPLVNPSYHLENLTYAPPITYGTSMVAYRPCASEPSYNTNMDFNYASTNRLAIEPPRYTSPLQTIADSGLSWRACEDFFSLTPTLSISDYGAFSSQEYFMGASYPSQPMPNFCASLEVPYPSPVYPPQNSVVPGPALNFSKTHVAKGKQRGTTLYLETEKRVRNPLNKHNSLMIVKDGKVSKTERILAPKATNSGPIRKFYEIQPKRVSSSRFSTWKLC